MQLGDLIALGDALGDSTAPSTTASTASTATPTSTPAVVPGFMDGLKAWATPATAIKLVPDLGTMFTLAGTGYTLGFLIPPLALVAIAVYMMQKKGK